MGHATSWIVSLTRVFSVLLQSFSVHDPHVTILLHIRWDPRASLQPPYGMLGICQHQDTLCRIYLSYKEKDWKRWLHQHLPFHHFFHHWHF